MMSVIYSQFSRDEIQTGDFSRFISSWGLHNLTEGPRLRSHFNRFIFRVHGYEENPCELYEIPEVRTFFQSFNSAWPFWFFGCNLSSSDLRIMTLCCLPQLTVIRRQSTSFCQIAYRVDDLRQFVLKAFCGMNFLFERAGMSQAENQARSKRIIEYFRHDRLTNPSVSRGPASTEKPPDKSL